MPNDAGHVAETPYELRAGPYTGGELRVLSFDGREEMNALSWFDVVVWSQSVDEGQLETGVLGRPAALAMHLGATSRYVRGIVCGVVLEGRREGGRHTYRLTIVPKLWRLGKRVNSRIFQDKTVQQIADAILDEHGIARDWHLLAKYPVRQYCVQYQETDYHFLTRILAEEGLFFFFDHPADGAGAEITERLVLADNAHSYPAIDGDPGLAFRQQSGEGSMHAEENHVLDFRPRTRMEPTAATLRDYDFQRPRLELSGTAGAGEPPDGGRALEIYDHHGEYEETDTASGKAGVYLEQLRTGVREAHGMSLCRRLLPGHRFELHDHDLEKLNAGHVVTHVEHRGIVAEGAAARARVYENRFRCVPADVAFRPARPARVIQQVTESAVVVGPPGQEVFTDPHGRVKVQFHWDREGKRDEHSSCWLRVAQAWAGAGFGHQFTPRIGMEVLVSFLGGDADRPVITGCLYNAENPVPLQLPKEAAQSAIRTRSVPGGGGFNELRFDDSAGGEQIAVRAQRDLVETVQHDHTETVGHDLSLNVSGQHFISVLGDRTDRIAGALNQEVSGGASVTVSGDASSTSEGSVSAEILQNRNVKVHGTDTTTVLGDSTTIVEGPHVLRVEALHTVLVGEGRDDGQADISVTGKYLLSSGGLIHVRADDTIVLAAGESSIEISPSGVVIKAKAIELEGSDGVTLAGPGPAMRLDKEAEIVSKVVRIYSEDASIELDKEATIVGKAIHLNRDGNKPRPKSADGKPHETQTFSITLTDENFKPYSGKKYRMACGGEKFEGTTSGDGLIAHDVLKGAQSAQITIWLTSSYPMGPMKRYSVEIKPLPDPGSIKGAQARLKNLGYYRGAAKGVIDDETREALRSFQRDHKLKETGELDDATKGKLVEVHKS